MPSSHDPANPAELMRRIRALGLVPNKLRGQNFLVDAAVADELVYSAPLTPRASVLEIGPGFGVITQRLLEAAGHVVAVEADIRLAGLLAHEHREEQGLTVFPEDALTFNRAAVLPDFGYHLVASLPYSITARVFRFFLATAPRPKSITVLVQQEVAERIAAPVGKLSQLGVLCQVYAKPAVLHPGIPPDAFYPPPQVHSAILQLTKIKEQSTLRSRWRISEQTFWKVVRAGFQNRRKMLKNTLANLPGIDQKGVESWLAEHRYPITVRAQDIMPQDWVSLAGKFFDE